MNEEGFGASEKRTQDRSEQKAQQSDLHGQWDCHSALPSLRHLSTGVLGPHA